MTFSTESAFTGAVKLVHPSPLSGLRRLYRLWRQRSHERAMLAALSAREWRDMGMTATDVLRELNKPFRRT